MLTARKWLGIIFLMGISHLSTGQTRIYLLSTFNGGTEELGAWYYGDDGKRIGYLTKFGKPGVELAIEKRIAGSFYAYVGLNYTQFESAYNETGSALQSQVSQSFVSMPVMLRLNIQNRNKAYFDFGLMPTYLTKADLKESSTYDANSAGAIQKDEGDVANWIPRLGVMYKQSTSIAIRRFIIGFYLAVNLANDGNGELVENWKVDDSIFISYGSRPVWATYGLHFGYRIK